MSSYEIKKLPKFYVVVDSSSPYHGKVVAEVALTREDFKLRKRSWHRVAGFVDANHPLGQGSEELFARTSVRRATPYEIKFSLVREETSIPRTCIVPPDYARAQRMRIRELLSSAEISPTAA